MKGLHRMAAVGLMLALASGPSLTDMRSLPVRPKRRGKVAKIHPPKVAKRRKANKAARRARRRP